MHVVIFEGNRWKSFAPLALSRPVFMLRCGMSTLLEQQIRHLRPTRLTLWVRPQFADYCRQQIIPKLNIPADVNTPLDDEIAMLASGRTLHLQKFEYPLEPSVVLDEDNLVLKAMVRSPGLGPQDVITRSSAWMKLLELPHAPPHSRLPQYVWDLCKWNEEALVADAIQMYPGEKKHPAGPFHMMAEEDVHIGTGVKIEPGVVLDASNGPVVIENSAVLGAHSVLRGPVHIGAGTVVSPHAFIGNGTSIGPGCKVGGEISSTIMLPNSNKAHYGYLGDSYIGEWVNMGAGTTTSNLKNTYGHVKMHVDGKEIDTGRRFLGSMVGDHTKTAIGTRLNTGSYIGFCNLLAGSAIAPHYMPSFTYWTDDGASPYRPDKAAEVIAQVYQRRGRSWTDADQQMLEHAAEMAKEAEKG